MTPALAALPAARRIEAIRAVERVRVLQGSTRDFDVREVAQLKAQYPTVFVDG